MRNQATPQWMQYTLLLAGLYNIIWGCWVMLFPTHLFAFAGMPQPIYLWPWQTVGMAIFVFGVAYILAYRDPIRYWPLIAAGLLGRIMGPVGFMFRLVEGSITWKFGITIITNDLIWLAPFSMILWRAYKQHGK